MKRRYTVAVNRRMEPNAEENGYEYSDLEEERKKRQRPPSSYGSMKSESDDIKYEASGAEEEQCDQEVAGVFNRPAPALSRGTAMNEATGVQMDRPVSPETQYTMTTQQTKPPGALVYDTGFSDMVQPSDDNEDLEDEYLITNSPEPPEPIEMEDEIQMDEYGQPGKLHAEQDLPHVFRNIQRVLTGLKNEELSKFRLNFNQPTNSLTLQQLFEGDLLDFVDRILETFGIDNSLSSTISTLENITKHEEAEELRLSCKKALIRSNLKQDIIRKYEFIYEGIPQPGKRRHLDNIYVHPELCRCSCGGVNPSHELRSPLQPPSQSPNADTLVSLNNLFRLQKPNGQPVRTVLTSGIPGIGMTVSVGKYCYDWAEHRANKDLEYVITLPFDSLWLFRKKHLSSSTNVTIMDVIEYHHSLCKTKKYLDDEDCRFLIIMASFDCYNTSLDWQNTPVIKEKDFPAKVDDLVVNLIRGTLLPNAQIWILGRRAAVSQIPTEFIDDVTEIHGFSDEMKDNYLTKRFENTATGDRIVNHYKRLPTLRILAQQPFVCWMVAKIFSHNFRRENYGTNPPKLTCFLVNILVIQTNRRLQFYYEKPESNLKWSTNDREMLKNLGKMALKMLEKNTNVFTEEDTNNNNLSFTDVTVFSGLCTEMPPTSSGKRRFCFIHFTVQEFIAALYVFTMLHLESKNVLDNGVVLNLFTSSQQTRSAVDVVQYAVNRTLRSPLGQYDMFLRFLCGLLSSDNNRLLHGNLYDRSYDKVHSKEEVRTLLEKTIENTPQDRVENLRECVRELTQVED